MTEDTTMEFPNRFDEAFDRIKRATGMRTQVEIAKLLDIRQSSISDAKRRQSIPDSWLIKLFQIFNLNPNWLLDGEAPQFLGEGRGGAVLVREPGETYGHKPKHYPVPVAAMALPEGTEAPWKELAADSLTIPEQFYRPSLLVVRMEESDMEPTIRRGAYVGIDRERKALRSGTLYAIDMPVEGLVIKRILHDTENARLILHSENQLHADQILLAEGAMNRVIGRVIWVFQEI